MKLSYLRRCALLLLYSNTGFAAGFVSSTNNGVYLAFSGPSRNEPINYAEKLVWGAFCTNGTVELNYPAPAFSIKIKMTGPDGREVPKTDLGSGYGTKFDKVRRFEDTIDQGQVGYHAPHTGVIFASGMYVASEGVASGPLLPSPQQLFEMSAPGKYKLEIEMQMFQVVKGTNWTRKLLRFERIEIPVVKPSD